MPDQFGTFKEVSREDFVKIGNALVRFTRIILVRGFLSVPVPGRGGGLEAGAHTKGLPLRAVCSDFRSKNQGGRGDRKAAWEQILEAAKSEDGKAPTVPHFDAFTCSLE